MDRKNSLKVQLAHMSVYATKKVKITAIRRNHLFDFCMTHAHTVQPNSIHIGTEK